MDQNPIIPSSELPKQNQVDTPQATTNPTVSMPGDPTNTSPDVPISPNPALPNKKKNRLIIAIVIAVVLLVIGGLVGFVLTKKEPVKSVVNTEPVTTSKKADSTIVASSVISNCLRPADYGAVRDADSLPKYYDDETQSTMVSESIFFKPNSTNYEYDSQTELYAKYAKFYNLNKDKSWKFEIQGQIKDVDGSGNSPSNTKLANDRAQKIKIELVGRGFDGARISTLAPEVYTGDEEPIDSDRNVSITLESQCIKDKEPGL